MCTGSRTAGPPTRVQATMALPRGLPALSLTLRPPLCLPAPQPEACRTLAPEKDKAAKHCSIQLPDGTACVVLVRAGLSIKEVLAGLCERHGINGAAVDLFLVGGDKVQGCGDRGRFLWGRLPCGRPCRWGSRLTCVYLPERAGSLPPWPVLGLTADSALCSMHVAEVGPESAVSLRRTLCGLPAAGQRAEAFSPAMVGRA